MGVVAQHSRRAGSLIGREKTSLDVLQRLSQFFRVTTVLLLVRRGPVEGFSLRS